MEQTFAAGHALRNYHGKCENVHGHNYRVQVTLEGERAGRHRPAGGFRGGEEADARGARPPGSPVLNDLPPFDVLNPSAENMAKYFYDGVCEGLKTREGVRVGAIRLWETDTASATYRPHGSHNSRLVNQLFRQADSLAKCLQPRIAAQQAGTFTIHTKQKPADPNRAKPGDVIQGFEDSVFIA